MSRYTEIKEYLCHFLEDEVKKTGLNKVVIGLSGIHRIRPT